MRRIGFRFLLLSIAVLAVLYRTNDLLRNSPLNKIQKISSNPSVLDLRDIRRIRTLITQGYGSRRLFFIDYSKGYHNGIDIGAQSGVSIYSPVAGEVIAAGDQDTFCRRENYGKFIVVKDQKEGAALLFAHLNRMHMNVGDAVSVDQIIANVGNTGRTTAPHLHFTVFKNGTFELRNKNGCGSNPEGRDINPLRYLESL
ncbi:M23 family metallopeptidase [Candidatus Parcubacteria bacterium]|nr:MAG: M23 family metallopeptidase [Candidatus Parcubacteria bacterium]